MYIKTIRDLDIRHFTESLVDFEFMVYVGQDSANELELAMETLNELGIKFFGGIYPKLIVDGKVTSAGYIIKRVQALYSELVYPHLMKKLPALNEDQSYTGYLFGDGFSVHNDDLLQTIKKKVKGKINYIGGGSAIYENSLGIHKVGQDSVVFNNAGFFLDAMYLCIVPQESVSYENLGWDIIDGPFQVTEAEGNLIKSIDHENAFEFYKTMLDEVEGVTIQDYDSFFYAAQYSFGLLDNRNLSNVRVPVEVTNDGYIKVVNQIERDTDIYLLRANRDDMVSKHYILQGRKDLQKPFMVSCLSRDMYLDQEFLDEIDTIESLLGSSVEGIISVGEFKTNDSRQLMIYEGATVLNLINE